MRGRGVFQQFLHRVPVEPGDGAQPTGDRGAGPAAVASEEPGEGEPLDIVEHGWTGTSEQRSRGGQGTSRSRLRPGAGPVPDPSNNQTPAATRQGLPDASLEVAERLDAASPVLSR